MQIPNVLTLFMTISSTNNCWFLESEVVLSGVKWCHICLALGFDSLLDSHSTENIDYKISRLAHIDTTFSQWMSTVIIKKNIILRSTERNFTF